MLPHPRKLRPWVKGVLFLTAIFFGFRWWQNPEGPYEPIICLCSLLLAAIDSFFLTTSSTQTPPVSLNNVEILPDQRSSDYDSLPEFTAGSPTAFFAQRFASAFPGLRETTWFSKGEAVDRLAILLAPPLTFSRSSNSKLSPIWWLRFGNSHIESFSILNRNTVLMDEKELLIDKIAAAYSADYKRLFVYVACSPMPPCGAYEWTPENLKQLIDDYGYVHEEYGLYRGTHIVSRAEYDDGATMLKGKIVQMDSDLELRVRYLTPYNFILVGHDSPINNNSFDSELEQHLNKLLTSPNQLEALVERVKSLPPNRAIW